MGAVTDLGVDIQGAEDEIDRKWSKKQSTSGGDYDSNIDLEVKGEGVGLGTGGKEKII